MVGSQSTDNRRRVIGTANQTVTAEWPCLFGSQGGCAQPPTDARDEEAVGSSDLSSSPVGAGKRDDATDHRASLSLAGQERNPSVATGVQKDPTVSRDPRSVRWNRKRGKWMPQPRKRQRENQESDSATGAAVMCNDSRTSQDCVTT